MKNYMIINITIRPQILKSSLNYFYRLTSVAVLNINFKTASNIINIQEGTMYCNAQNNLQKWNAEQERKNCVLLQIINIIWCYHIENRTQWLKYETNSIERFEGQLYWSKYIWSLWEELSWTLIHKVQQKGHS